jgi:glycosyltransferase involved in cell wall biosynthesis
MKKVWILSEYFYPNDVTTSIILTKIAEGLSEKADVNVITSTSSVNRGIKFERFNNINIYRVKESSLDKNNLYKRIIKMILLGLRLFYKSAILLKKNDTVLVVTNPATIIFLIAILRTFKRINLVILVHDIFPENLVVAKILNANNIFYKITLHLFNWAYKKADKLIVIGRDMEAFMKNKLGKRCPETVFIPNFVDSNLIKPESKKQNKILKKYDLTEKFVLLFTGNIGRAQDFSNILETMELLKDNDQIHLLIIGDGVNAKYVTQIIKEKNLKNITLLPLMKREFANEFLNAGDIGLVSLQKGRKGIVVPSKTYPFLAAGKPVLAIVDKDSEIYLMVNESHCGWWSEPGNPLTLKNSIDQIYGMGDEIIRRSLNARKLAIEKYSLEKVIPQFQLNLCKQSAEEKENS